MGVTHVEELYDYNRWANSRILNAVSKLTPEEFTRDLGSSHRSVRDTLVHVMSAEWIWLMRWKGISPKAMLDPSDFPTIALLESHWAEIEREQTEFVSGVTEASLEKIIAYVNTKGQPFEYALWKMMVQVVNHSTYHRGQVIAMLRQLGAEPVATDLLVFYNLESSSTGRP